MTAIRRLADWPLRAKFAAVLIVASLLPVFVLTLISVDDSRQRLLAQTSDLLGARGDQLAASLDAFNESYQHTAERIAHLPLALQSQPGGTEAKSLEGMLRLLPESDTNVLAVAILDAGGAVRAASDPRLARAELGDRAYVRTALNSGSAISSVRYAEAQIGAIASMVVTAPIRAAGRPQAGCAVLWIRASGLWDLMRASSGLAGPGSYGILLDAQGIRIAHTYRDDLVFRPTAPLSADTLNALVSEQRFGAQTRQLLEDVRPFAELGASAAAKSPDPGLFRAHSTIDARWTYGVARRLRSAPWTVFYLVPEDVVLAQLGQMTRQVLLFAALITLLALAVGMAFAANILKPIQALAAATTAIGGGDHSARVPVSAHNDELGLLGASFNRMAQRIESQSQELLLGQQQLETRVRQRTAELAREVEERSRAEEASRASQRLLEGIVDSSDDAIISKTLQGIITSWNAGAERLFGYSSADAIGRSMLMLIPPERMHEEPEILARIASGSRVDHFETVRVRADGTRIDISASLSPIRDSSGRIIGASKIARDITERKEQERRQGAQLERLNLLQQITRAIGERQDLASIFQVVIGTLEDQLPADFGCICLYQPQDGYVTVSEIGRRSAELSGAVGLSRGTRIEIQGNGLLRCVSGQLVYEPEIAQSVFALPRHLALGGLNSLVVVPLAVESQVFGVIVAARREKQAFSSAECEFLRQVAEHAALAAKQSELYGALQRAYEDLRQTQQAVMQQERLRALGQMASGIAHDINNAIAPMMLYTEYLLDKEPNLSDRARGYLKTMEQSISDVAETVARMREFYRNREAQQALVPVQVNVLVQQVIALTRARWSDIALRGGAVIEVCTELAEALPDILGIESELREALTNLVLNAVDAMPKGGRIKLRTRLDAAARRVYLEVVDDGLGMDECTRERCLEPFFTTKGLQGTGLGLAMVYGTVQRHDGSVEIDSAPGLGTTMRLGFPLPTAAAAAAADMSVPTAVAASAAATLTAPAAKLSLLLIDDDPLVLRSLRDALEGDGHRIVIANGGQAGVDAFFAARDSGEGFSAVITDLGMPYFDGRRVAATLKAASPLVPIILLTGWGQRLAIEGDLPPHVDLVLSKPPRLAQLREALAQCIRESAARTPDASAA